MQPEVERNIFKFLFPVLLVCSAIFLLRSFTLSGPITWDEPIYLHGSQDYMHWVSDVFHGIASGHFTEALSQENIDKYWYRHTPTLPLAKIINGVTWVLFRKPLGDLAALRCGTALFYSALFGFVAWHSYRLTGPFGAFASVVILFVNPRLYFHAGTSNLDTIGMVMSYLSLLYFWNTSDQKQLSTSLIAGLLWGLAFAAKNALLLAGPMLFLWILIWKRRGYLFLRLLIMQIMAVAVLLALWPWLWHDTLNRLNEFSQWARLTGLFDKVLGLFHLASPGNSHDLKLSRSYGLSSGIKVGDERVISWHYPLDVMGVVLPIATILLWIAGTILCFRRIKDPDRAYVLLGAWVPIALTTLPFVPIYGMERFLLICMPFIALLGGIAAHTGLQKLQARVGWKKHRTTGFAVVALCLCYTGAVREWITLHPLELSYYNAFIGGLPGAAEKGYPINYWLQNYWAAMPYLNQNATPNARVAGVEDAVLKVYQEFGLLRSDLVPIEINRNPKGAAKMDYFLSRTPYARKVFTYSLHGVEMISVEQVTPAYLQYLRREQRDKRDQDATKTQSHEETE